MARFNVNSERWTDWVGDCAGCGEPIREGDDGWDYVKEGQPPRSHVYCEICYKANFKATCSCCSLLFDRGDVGTDGLCWACWMETKETREELT